MSKRNKRGKNTLGMLKGKSITTSFPTIRFNANDEKLEELYASDDDQPSSDTSNVTQNNEETSSSSPLRTYLPKLINRTGSVDISNISGQDSSPPTDRWKFFTEIKGKITKSVEEKITEIKTRNHDGDSSPKKTKEEKEGSSLSDSEDLSESSISKTCGVWSTTEGPEMSTDEETDSLEREDPKTPKPEDHNSKPVASTSGLRKRFRLTKKKTPSKESFVSINSLQGLYNINTDDPIAFRTKYEDVESGVEASEDINFNETDAKDLSDEAFARDILKKITDQIDNVAVDDQGTIVIEDVEGSSLRDSILCGRQSNKTLFAPTGFVDVRKEQEELTNQYWLLLRVLTFVVLYYFIQSYSVYLAGLMTGIVLAQVLNELYRRVFPVKKEVTFKTNMPTIKESKTVIEVPAAKEYQPYPKFEGWMNELPEEYSPTTYHISQTQPVFLRLQGNLLKVSNSKAKFPKKAMWNEHLPSKPQFVAHRVYNLLGARVELIPEGLTKVRYWSRKYPIRIIFNKDQMNLDVPSKEETISTADLDACSRSSQVSRSNRGSHSSQVSNDMSKKFSPISMSQQFSKLTDSFDSLEPDQKSTDSWAVNSDESLKTGEAEFELQSKDFKVGEEDDDEDDENIDLELESIRPPVFTEEIKIYLFGRTARGKEDWFRQLRKATHKLDDFSPSQSSETKIDCRESMSDSVLGNIVLQREYMETVGKFCKSVKNAVEMKGQLPKQESEAENFAHTLWLNAFLGRILFDCIREETMMEKVKARIQRKLFSIKLPYLIDTLICEDVSLGNTVPRILRTYTPVVDQRGIWVDLDIMYRGNIVLILQTKLNLMKLKNDHRTHPEDKKDSEQRSAVYHSDVDDTAESSTDDEHPPPPPPPPPPATSAGAGPAPPLDGYGPGGYSNKHQKLINVMDKIADSKFFKAATDTKIIKNWMEGVSQTDLRLKVEVKALIGTVVFNLPPPPSDRLWFGFRPMPKLKIKAQPAFGERSINMMRITKWIEKKLHTEFQKVMVLPNMEDISVGVMNHNLPK